MSCLFRENLYTVSLLFSRPIKIIFTGKQSHSNTLDEFGRDRTMFQDLARQRRIAEREGRKKRRRQQREQDRNKGNDKADNHHEGLSTDDEQTEGEILKYKTETG